MSFCLQCGSKTEFLCPPGDTHLRQVCPKCKYVHYENPKIILGTLSYLDHQIVLCKRNIEPRKNKWTIPAGFMECGETLQEGALRETAEEAGLHIKLKKLYVIYTIPRISQVYMVYLCDLLSTDWKAGPETNDIQLFHFKDIPWDEIAFTAVTFTLKQFISDFSKNSFELHQAILK